MSVGYSKSGHNLSVAKPVNIFTMVNLSRNEKKWLILFGLVLTGLVAGCMYETVVYHSPIGPRPVIKKASDFK